MSSYWVNFVASGNPNGPGLPEWPAYNLNTKQIMALNENPAAEEMPDYKALDFMHEKMNAGK